MWPPAKITNAKLGATRSRGGGGGGSWLPEASPHGAAAGSLTRLSSGGPQRKSAPTPRLQEQAAQLGAEKVLGG